MQVFSGFSSPMTMKGLTSQLKVNHQRPKFVMRRPELKIPTLAKMAHISISTCHNQNL